MTKTPSFDSELSLLSVTDRARVLELFEQAKPATRKSFELNSEIIRLLCIVDRLAKPVDSADQNTLAQHYVDQHSLQLIDDRDKIQLELTKNEQPLRRLAKECSTLICKPFAAVVYNRLPRELRDQVYDLLWTDEEVEQFDQVIGTSKDPPRLNHCSDPAVPSERAVPFFADADFTGPEFAHEAAVWYFKMRTRAEIHYGQVRSYIERNEFGGVKLAPINFIRRLTINLEWVMPYADHLSNVDLRECMESLLTLKDKKRLAIEIYLSRDMQFSRTMFQALELIRPFFLEMKKNGFPPKLMGYQWFTPRWRQVNPDRVEERKTYATVELLNYFFDGTPEEWLAMKSEEIEADENHTRRKKCFLILENMEKNLLDVDADIPRGMNGPPGLLRSLERRAMLF